jgi:hypothetical protein
VTATALLLRCHQWSGVCVLWWLSCVWHVVCVQCGVKLSAQDTSKTRKHLSQLVLGESYC